MQFEALCERLDPAARAGDHDLLSVCCWLECRLPNCALRTRFALEARGGAAVATSSTPSYWTSCAVAEFPVTGSTPWRRRRALEERVLRTRLSAPLERRWVAIPLPFLQTLISFSDPFSVEALFAAAALETGRRALEHRILQRAFLAPLDGRWVPIPRSLVLLVVSFTDAATGEALLAATTRRTSISLENLERLLASTLGAVRAFRQAVIDARLGA